MRKLKKLAKQIDAKIRLAIDRHPILSGIACGIVANFITDAIKASFG